MNALRSITFLSDFGWGGGYVAACEATIARLCPEARVFHISQEVPVGDVAAAALVLARVTPLYPRAVHLAVVDPGVGTNRRPLALSTARGDFLVGPDNGLLLDAGDALGGLTGGWTLDMAGVRTAAGLPLEGISNTFHGRDLFAPASALLACGADPSLLGRPLDLATLARLTSIPPRPTDGGIAATVIEIDRFGNVGLGLRFVDVPSGGGAPNAASGPEAADGRFFVGVAGEGAPEWTARVVTTYGDLAAGELGLIRDSWGQAALALNGASAAEFLGVRRGTIVALTPVSISTGKATE